MATALGFASGSNATISNLAPREARYFKVTVAANTPSWEITLDPTVGEMLLMARRGTIPDLEPYLPGNYASNGTQPDGSREMRLQKDGPERYLILPPDNSEYLLPGDYYLAVVSEGQSPADSGHVGTGNSSGLLTAGEALPWRTWVR